MKNNKDIENQRKDIDFILLARMAKQRKDTPLPNIDEEWEKFTQSAVQQSEAGSKKPSYRIRYMVSAFMGAAAMFLLMMLFTQLVDGGMGQLFQQPYVALEYAHEAPIVTFRQDSAVVPITQTDSISFLRQPVARPLVAQTKLTPMSEPESAPIAPKLQQLSTPRGMDFKVVLSDGSEVWLNAESSIEFPATFVGQERMVRLKGEAYFKVAHNADFPFVVQTDHMNVRVLGTEFNLKAYDAEQPTVSLVEGSVEVSRSLSDDKVCRLVPGQQACYNDDGEVQVDKADVYEVQQWVNGFFYFDNKPLIEILRNMGRWYNYGVIFRSTRDMHKHLHFSTERNESMENAIDALCRLVDSKIAIEDNHIIVY